MAKPGKEAAEDEEAPVKPKGKRLLLVVLALLVLGALGGAAWYFISGSKHGDDKPKEKVPVKAVFMDLEPFTVNLQREETDQYLQVGISLKLPSSKLEEEIQMHLPEIRSRLLFLLSSKRPSELVPTSGKKKLAHDIAVEIDATLGLRVLPGKKGAGDVNAPEKVEAISTASSTASAPEKGETEDPAGESNGAGVMEVLFTSFIIQ